MTRGQARWRRDGSKLFYIALDERLMAVPIRLSPNGQAAEADAPVPLFTTQVGGAVQGGFSVQYTVSSDGQDFLMLTPAGGAEDADPPRIIIVQNWFEELRRLVPTD